MMRTIALAVTALAAVASADESIGTVIGIDLGTSRCRTAKH